MESIELNAAALTERAAALEELEAALALPPWWGRNLDALHDCLTESPRRICLREAEALETTAFGQSLRRVFAEAAEENPGLELVWDCRV